MVETAMMLPDDVVENVARRHGEVSSEAVREMYTEEEIARFQREARDSDEMTVLAALDRLERERVEEAAAEAGEHPAVWLANVTVEQLDDSGPVAAPETLAEQVERAIFQRTDV